MTLKLCLLQDASSLKELRCAHLPGSQTSWCFNSIPVTDSNPGKLYDNFNSYMKRPTPDCTWRDTPLLLVLGRQRWVDPSELTATGLHNGL